MNEILQLAVYRILKTIMRILYSKGIAFADFNTLAKQAYINIVEQELAETGDRVTTTKIAAITGLTRKDVSALRRKETINTDSGFNRSLRVINGWMNDPEFFDDKTQLPSKLPFRGKQGSFELLVQRYSGDMSCFALLDEMKRTGVIRELFDGQIELLNNVVILYGDEKAKVELLGTDVSLLISTIEHNLKTDDPEDLYYQRKVSYNNLPEEVLPSFRVFVERDAQQLLLRFNDWLYRYDRDSKNNSKEEGTGKMQAGVGIYYFEKPVRSKRSQGEA